MQKGNAHFSAEYSIVCVCVCVCVCVFSSSNWEDLVGSKLLTLVYDPGFHLEMPYVLFGKQTLYGVLLLFYLFIYLFTSAVLIQTLCSTIALKTSDTQISFQRPFLWCFPSSTL